MHYYITLPILIGSLALASCASVNDTNPTSKVVHQQPQIVTSVASNYQQTGHTVQRAEAPIVCDNANMRERASDNNSHNDSARVLILEDNARSNTVLADVTVDCKDYFANQAQYSRNIRSIQSHATVYSTAPEPAPSVPTRTHHQAPAQARTIAASSVTTVTNNQRMYRIRSGDNLYRIARNNCTDTDTLAEMNNIYDPSRISPGQMIRLPRGCN